MLENNRDIAVKRLEGLRKQLKCNKVLANKYNSVINGIYKACHIVSMSYDESHFDSEAWWLPHFTTKQEKFRVVFDAKAKNDKGISINSCLYKGTENLNSICGILMRF